jgi:hypothetical protein
MEDKNKIYRAFFEGGDPHNRKSFFRKRFIMPISVGQNVHENGRMESTLSLVSRSFKSGVVLIDDVVQRHTLKIHSPNLSDTVLYEMAREDGNIWLQRYQHRIQKTLGDKVSILRWEYFLKHADFNACEKKVRRLLKDNPLYKESFERNINEFIGRCFKKNPGLDYLFAYNQCEQYLIEECSAMQLWPTLDVQVEVYPSDRNHAMQATNRELIEPQVPGGLEHVSLWFKKINSSEAQPSLPLARH